MQRRYRCLVVGPSWVGDMMMAQSLFKALAEIHPDGLLDVLAPAWSHGILARMPEVRSALLAPFVHGVFGLSERWRRGRELAGEKYDQAIVLPNSWKSALVPYFAGIPLRTGYVGEFRHGLLNDRRHLDEQALPRLVDRYSALAYAAGEEVQPSKPPQLRVNVEAQQTKLKRLGLNRDRPILALCPGAEFGNAKRWPAAHYAAVARIKLIQGWQVWLLGSAKDKADTNAITSLLPTPPPGRESGWVADIAGHTSLEEVVDLLACASAVVCNDSGLMHIAAAVNVPVVALYGSTDPGYTPPFSDQARVLSLGLKCSPCFKRECPKGHLDCLNKLEPEQVLSLLDDLEISP